MNPFLNLTKTFPFEGEESLQPQLCSNSSENMSADKRALLFFFNCYAGTRFLHYTISMLFQGVTFSWMSSWHQRKQEMITEKSQKPHLFPPLKPCRACRSSSPAQLPLALSLFIDYGRKDAFIRAEHGRARMASLLEPWLIRRTRLEHLHLLHMLLFSVRALRASVMWKFLQIDSSACQFPPFALASQGLKRHLTLQKDNSTQI